jgi:hypothetical protein
MVKIIISENVSLDGVIQDPAGDEGFRHGGWIGRIGDRPGRAPHPWSRLVWSQRPLRIIARLAGSCLGLVEIDERDPDIGAHHLAQPRRGLCHDGLQRREDAPLQQVASACRPVR